MSNENTDYENKDDLTSDFNEAKFQILRLHNLWIKCNSLSQQGKLGLWKWNLDCIWRELSPDARQKNEEKYYSKLKEINSMIANATTPKELYEALNEKEIFLRYLQEDVGKGGKKSHQDDDAMDD